MTNRLSLKKTNTVLLLCVAVLFCVFVVYWEKNIIAYDNNELHNNALVISDALLSLDNHSSVPYLELALKHQHLERITVFDSSGELFLQVIGSPCGFFDDALESIGLIPRVTLYADVLHDLDFVGKIETVHHHDTIYLYFHLSLIIGFILLAYNLYMRTVQKESFLQSIFKSAPVGINLVVDRNIYWSNKKFSEITGYSVNEIKGKNVRFLYTNDEDYEQVGHEIYEAIEKYGSGKTETRWQRKDGSLIDVYLRASKVQLQDFTNSVTFTVQDITQQKQAERNLKESAQRLQLALEGAELGMWDWETQNGNVYFSPGYFSMLGYGPTELPHTLATFKDLLHPNDLELTIKQLTTCLAVEHSKWSLEFRLRAKNGEYRWILGRGKVVEYATDGSPLRAAGTHLDINDHKKLVEEIVKGKEEWEKTFDSMSDIITIQDTNMRIVRANRAAYKILGANPDSLDGQFCYKLFSGGTTVCPGCPGPTTLTSMENHSAIIYQEKLDKTFLVSHSPILDDNNEVQYMIHVARDVTEQKRLEEQQVMFNSLIQQSNDAIYVIDLNSADILFTNHKGYEILGYDHDEQVRLTIHDILHTVKIKEDWQRNLDALRRRGFSLFEITYQKKDNSLLDIEVNARITRYSNQDFVVAVARDISERKKAEEKIFQEKNKLEAVVASMGSGLTFQDRNFKIIYQNATHKQMRGDLVGEVCYEAFHGRDDICPDCQLAICYEDGKIHHREASREKDGSTIFYDISASPFLDGNGNIIGGVECITDITDRKVLEAQIQQAQKMEAIGTLAGGIAHDFNNILTAIMGYNDMALQDIPEENPVHHMLEHMAKGTERARDLVQQILTFSRKSDLVMTPITLQPTVKEALKLLRATMPSTIKLTSDIAPDHVLVLADSTMIHQLVMNLCTNSYHAMRESGGELSVQLKPVTVGQELAKAKVDLQEGPYMLLTVSDTGHGIDQDTLKRIFEPYYTTKAKGDGTGLGLAVVHGTVSKLGGGITVASEVETGTTFQVYLPQAETVHVSKEKASEKDALKGQGHILLVDDEKEITTMTSLQLSRLGYQVTSFNSSRQALDSFRETPDKYDLIITDQTMPELTGIELAKRIKEMRPDTPIILTSGYSEQVDSESYLAMGFSAYQGKPFKVYEIGKVIQKILNRA